MSLWSRLLGLAGRRRPAGASLESGPRWVVAPPRDPAALLRALPILFPAEHYPDGRFATFEDLPERRFAAWLAARAVDSPLQVALGTLWPRPAVHTLPLSWQTLDEAADFVERERIVLPAIHLHVHDGRRVLLEWHDAFGQDPLSVAGSIARRQVEEFARAVGVGDIGREAG